jgi:hypothetical protein
MKIDRKRTLSILKTVNDMSIFRTAIFAMKDDVEGQLILQKDKAYVFSLSETNCMCTINDMPLCGLVEKDPIAIPLKIAIAALDAFGTETVKVARKKGVVIFSSKRTKIRAPFSFVSKSMIIKMASAFAIEEDLIIDHPGDELTDIIRFCQDGLNKEENREFTGCVFLKNSDAIALSSTTVSVARSPLEISGVTVCLPQEVCDLLLAHESMLRVSKSIAHVELEFGSFVFALKTNDDALPASLSDILEENEKHIRIKISDRVIKAIIQASNMTSIMEESPRVRISLDDEILTVKSRDNTTYSAEFKAVAGGPVSLTVPTKGADKVFSDSFSIMKIFNNRILFRNRRGNRKRIVAVAADKD